MDTTVEDAVALVVLAVMEGPAFIVDVGVKKGLGGRDKAFNPTAAQSAINLAWNANCVVLITVFPGH